MMITLNHDDENNLTKSSKKPHLFGQLNIIK